MNFNYHIANLVSRITACGSNRVVFFDIAYNTPTLKLLSIFLHYNLVGRVTRRSEQVLRVFVRYGFGRSAFKKIKLVSKPSKRVFWTRSRLDLECRKLSFSGFFILSTNKGIKSSFDCLSSSDISGEVLLKISV